MKLLKSLGLITGSLLFVSSSHAQLITIEPDNYANGTVLNHIVPEVILSQADANNSPSTFFTITATTENFPGYAPTGARVFGVSGVNFFNNNQRLRFDFAQPTGLVSLEFGGGNFFSGETARLDAFGSTGNLLASYTSQPRLGGSFETLSISRPTSDIAWAVAYLPPDGGSFARFDRLQFNVVPEPSVAVLVLGIASLQFLRRRQPWFAPSCDLTS